MKTNLKLSLAGAALVSFFLLTDFRAQPAASVPVKEFMREKLESSKRVLEGITLEDFELVAKYARRLSAMSQEASWRAFPDPEYVRHSETFRRQAEDLARAANDRNLEGVTLAYFKVTMSCVECHKFVRGRKVATLERSSSFER